MAKNLRWAALISSWSNLLAGLILLVAFLTLAFGDPTSDWFLDVVTYTLLVEGVLYAVAGVCLSVIMFSSGMKMAMVSQNIITCGGVFFAVSAYGLPSKIISLRYVFPDGENVEFPDACAHYGITCFMIATIIGISGVMSLPKDRFISPFWGTVCFLMGAWSIGFSNWVPVLVGGMASYDTVDPKTMPSQAWTWPDYVRIFGSLCLIMGAVVFGVMDEFWRLAPSAREPGLIETSLSENVA